jgi:endonuclease/exonuclease/phosphatase family metal-dependent hydrolase
MPSELRIAFWNVQDLFEPSVVSRGPQSLQELNAKLENLAKAIQQFFACQGPDMLAIAEVHTQRILRDLESRVNLGPVIRVWEPSGFADQTGLAVLARLSRFSSIHVIAVQRPTVLARPRAMILECSLAGRPEPFLFVVNHWKSRMPSAPISDKADREQTADWLGQFLANERRTRNVIAVGDFNAEPFEAPFGELRLRARRTFSPALWSRATPAYLYNPAWKYLSEPDAWELSRAPAYKASRPKSSHGNDLVFDQILLSGAILRGGMMRFLESKLEYVTINQLTSRYNRNGGLVPMQWRFTSSVEYSGTSDHFPLAATFELN